MGNLFLAIGFVGFWCGVVAFFRPIPSLRLSKRRHGVGLALASLLVVSMSQPSDPKPRPETATTSRVEPLDKIYVSGLRWWRGGFDAVMMASFTIYNDNYFPIKDVVVTCVHAGNSGTRIDANRRTLYEYIAPRASVSGSDMNMGFIHSAAASTNCRVTDFSRG